MPSYQDSNDVVMIWILSIIRQLLDELKQVQNECVVHNNCCSSANVA